MEIEKELQEIKKELEEIKKELFIIREEAIKIEHLEEYAQSSNFPALIGIILLQLLTIFLLGWIMFKGGFLF
ncbi:MAG: hypothetical protein GXO21_04795 [Aquificae bacterium]|nr:hypothetical protein [Aquificota bacterium]